MIYLYVLYCIIYIYIIYIYIYIYTYFSILNQESVFKSIDIFCINMQT